MDNLILSNSIATEGSTELFRVDQIYISNATKEKTRRPTAIQKTQERNAALRAASPNEIYDVAKGLGLTDTQASILKAILDPKPHFSNIARINNVTPETVFNWGRILQIRSKGREQPRPKLSKAQEKIITEAFENAKDDPIGPNLTAWSRQLGVSVTTLKIRAKDKNIKGGGRLASKPKPKRDAVRKALGNAKSPINQAALARELGVSAALIGKVRRTEIENDPGIQKEAAFARSKELTFAERKKVLKDLGEPNPHYESIAQQTGCNRSTIWIMAYEYGTPSRRASFTPINAELYLDAAEIIVKRRLATAPREEVKEIVKRYIDLLPRCTINDIAIKYSDIPWDDFAAARITRHLNRLTDSQVHAIVTGCLDAAKASESTVHAARHFAALPEDMAQKISARRLNTLPKPNIDDVVSNYLELSSKAEIKEIVRKGLRKEQSNMSEGLIARLDGLRPWPASRTFLDLAITHYLAKAGISDEQDLQSLTDRKILCLNMTPDIYMGLQYVLAAHGAILNRRNIHRREGNKGGALAPNRGRLEKLAHLTIA